MLSLLLLISQLLPEGEARKATYKILKNRGLTGHRKKENRNPRVKRRVKYEKAVKRRKGQVSLSLLRRSLFRLLLCVPIRACISVSALVLEAILQRVER